MHWYSRTWDELTRDELYAIVQLRERVFVVEQRCPYLDADGYDPASRHLWATTTELVAYCRIVPAGTKYPMVSIGRVITVPAMRGTGLGKELMRRAIAECGDRPIMLGAQAHLEKFYRDLGFEPIGEPYDDDGIPHIDMRRHA